MRRLLGWIAALLLGGCSADIPEGKLACDVDADCPGGWVCATDRCYSSTQAAGDSDGHGDEGPPDAMTGMSDQDAAIAGSDGGPATATDAGVDAGPPFVQPVPGEGPLKPQEFGRVFFETLCEHISRCEPKLGQAVASLAAPPFCHPADLEATTVGFFLDAIDAGRLDFDGTAARTCVESFTTALCDQDPDFTHDPACENIFDGHVVAGKQCSFDEECEAGLRCIGESTVCGGICGQPRDNNEPCDRDEECASPLACRAGKCTSVGDEGAACMADADCKTGLYCGETGECSTRPDEGEPCAPVLGVSPCLGDLVCVGASLIMAGTCGAGKPAGSPCSGREPCAVGSRCASGLCRALVGRNGPCDNSDNCPYGTHCYSSECQPLPVVGDVCDEERPCAEGLCKGGSCELGITGNDCEGGVRQFPQCEGFCPATGIKRCEPKKAQGVSCMTNDQCADGLECQGLLVRTCEPGMCG